MNSVHKNFYYYRFRCSIIVLFLLGLVVPCIHLFTIEESTSVSVKYIFLPILLSLVAILVMTTSRKLLLGKLLAYDLDFKTIYMIERRKNNKKNQYHNLKLLTSVCFFDGNFQKVLSYASDILNSPNINDVFYARHLQIITLFIVGEHNKILDIINSQKDLLHQIKNDTLNDAVDYYAFINSYMSGDYYNAIDIMKSLLLKKDYEKLNHKKIVIFYFLRIVYEKLNDNENIKICTNEIIRLDPNSNTFFRNSIDRNFEY